MRSYEVCCPRCGQFHDVWESYIPLNEADADHVVLQLCFDCQLREMLPLHKKKTQNLSAAHVVASV